MNPTIVGPGYDLADGIAPLGDFGVQDDVSVVSGLLTPWGEETRAELLVELIALAFICDISRAGSLMFTTPQCGMHLQPFTGTDKNLHDIGHSSDDPGMPGQRLQQMTAAIAWHRRIPRA